MSVIKISPRPGMRGVVRELDPYRLPDGLASDTPVEVLRAWGQDVTVRTEDGREWVTQYWLVDVGTEWEINGQWFHESTPAALDYIEGQLAYTLAKEEPASMEWARATAIAGLERVLRKYRRLPP